MAHIIIIKSEINGGKTSFLRRLVKVLRARKLRVSGFLAPKKKAGSGRTYYIEPLGGGRRLKAVETGLSRPKAFPAAFRFAEKKVFREAGKSDLIMIDEAGPLELKGKGHCRLLKKLLKSFRGTLIVAVRKELVKAVLRKFGIKKSVVVKKLSSGEFLKKAGL